ncbi:SDR family oxidoreductase [Lichenifustis flavocetrariae]|uniref:SDR family oxidoreductase n=1 Tax=Lichenifustis flavocetrariae TaxID=2949735 RepID=A0AA41YZ60_9HYPH|nr:SDR family oxidoreductase [Lichenifustis flavocetrariae]MCW6509986.1 SDR family oxidoreductase [Lichenifustis flavocetrariae]
MTPITRSHTYRLVHKGEKMSNLRGKVALITGGTSGIGAATAKRFKAEGATVIVTGSNPTTLEAARRDLSGIEVVASEAGDTMAAKALIESVVAKHGRIDVLFVNAGIGRFAPIEAVDETFFDAIFDINVRGAYFVMKHAAPVMSDGGSIILTGSVSGVQGGVARSVYAASKAAIRSFGRTFAAELAPRRIRVNTISPGPIETPIFGKTGMSKEQLAGFMEMMMPQIPLKRIGHAEEVAAAALFLASDESSYTTGTELFVDGGMVDG